MANGLRPGFPTWLYACHFTAFNIFTRIGILSYHGPRNVRGFEVDPEEWVHFNRAAIRPHLLTDLNLLTSELEKVLLIARDFWTRIAPSKKPYVWSYLWWDVLRIRQPQEFEPFSNQYIVLDTCWKIFDRLDRNWVNKSFVRESRCQNAREGSLDENMCHTRCGPSC